MTLPYLYWRLFWRHWWQYLPLACLGVLGSAFALIPSYTARAFFDTLAGHAPSPFGLYGLVALTLAVDLANVVTAWLRGGMNAIVAGSVQGLVQTNLLHRILARPAARALPGSPGEALSVFRDDVERVAGFQIDRVMTIRYLTDITVATITMLRLSATLTALTLLPLTVVLFATHLLTPHITAARRAALQASGKVSGAISETFGAVQAIKLANAEDHVLEHLRRLNRTRHRAGLRDQLLGQLTGSLIATTTTLGTGVVLLFAGQAMQSGVFTVGDFALFTSLLTAVAYPLRDLGSALSGYRLAQVSYERLLGLLQGAPAGALVQPRRLPLWRSSPHPSHSAKTAADRLERLDAQQLSYRYPGSDRGVNSVSLALPRGSFTVVTGRVGAGKTTLLRVLLGLLPMDGGRLIWNGQAVADPGAFLVPPRCGYTPQAPRLFSETLRENILLGLPDDGDRLGQALRLAVLERDVGELDRGLDTVVGPRGIRLSGGQLQRAAAARMFAAKPELLVVDDLSSALDVETERTLWDRLFSQEGVTCLAVSHRHAALRRADHVIVLRDGRVEDEGLLHDLLGRCEEMRLLWSGQLDALAGRARPTGARRGQP